MPAFTALLIEKRRAVRFHKRLGERQAEPGAAVPDAAGGRELPERLKRDLDIVRAHADAGVAYAQDHFAASVSAVDTITCPPAR